MTQFSWYMHKDGIKPPSIHKMYDTFFICRVILIILTGYYLGIFFPPVIICSDYANLKSFTRFPTLLLRQSALLINMINLWIWSIFYRALKTRYTSINHTNANIPISNFAPSHYSGRCSDIKCGACHATSENSKINFTLTEKWYCTFLPWKKRKLCLND